ncbi:RNHCP domain-containing protein [Vibrio sp. 10N.261.51.F12]|uniref:RNHCP domain-containing protein n=1 Tax=Vibrio sp. 10N.261.51.F12 TaxID=3229679 RepID=UPI00354DA99D
MTRNKILRENPQESFICASCSNGVAPIQFGGQHRNHCPHCLCSVHMDIKAGDRRSSCRGIMEPISIFVQKDREWSLIHKCSKCNTMRMNRIAADDNELMLVTMAVEPLISLPFPSKSVLSNLKKISISSGGEDVSA